MNTQISAEIYWLTLTALFTGLLWVPYILNRLAEQGFLSGLWDPDGETATQVGWAERLMRAHGNAVENLVVFTPLVIALQLTGISTATTATACTVFFFARVAHAVLFTLRVPVLRIVAFLIGFVCQLVLAYSLITS